MAAANLRLDLADIWTAARTDTRLVVALAGRDPDAREEPARMARAEYLRLLAFGAIPSRAELIMGTGHTGRRRSDPTYSAACRSSPATTRTGAPPCCRFNRCPR
ncbi:hypothetical protein [Streptomyces sp. NPDC048419]|uniref:hypothetical protein n=1 Tax=Streptomyces sp. NPDC048419 TaxID=3365547 RepID=UPI00371D7DBF